MTRRNMHLGSAWIFLEAVAGVIVGLPSGLLFYYMPVVAFAEVVASSPARLWLDFNPIAVALLAMIALVAEFGLFRLITHYGFTIFARVFVASAALVSLLLFTVTAARQNPLLPFYGQ